MTTSLIGQTLEAVHWVQTQDLNPYGRAFGGVIMNKLDEVATLLAIQATKKNCVTASVSSIEFKHGVMLGDMLKLRAEIIDVGRASLKIAVSISKNNPKEGEQIVCPHSIIIMVAMDENFHPAPIMEHNK